MAQKNRLKLDFSLHTNVERKQFLDAYLQSDTFKERPPTDDELEMMGNYLLWGKDPKTDKNAEQEGLVTINTKHKTWQKKETASLDELMEAPTFSETSISALDGIQYKTPKEVFSRESTLANCPPSMVNTFRELFATIDKLELRLNFWEIKHGKREKEPRESLLKKFSDEEIRTLRESIENWNQHHYLKQRHLLVELRQEQYTLRDSYYQTIHTVASEDASPPPPEFAADIPVFPLGLKQGEFASIIFREWPQLNFFAFSEPTLEKISEYYWKMREQQKNVATAQSRVAAPYVDLREPEHVFQLLDAKCELEEVVLEQMFGSNLQAMLDTLGFYIAQADLTEVQRDILDRKINKQKNTDIAHEINKTYNKSYSDNYISTIFRQKIIPKIAAAAQYHEEVISRIFFEEDFKKCSDCGTIYLLDAQNFVRKARSKDGFSERCKKCDKRNRQEKKL